MRSHSSMDLIESTSSVDFRSISLVVGVLVSIGSGANFRILPNRFGSMSLGFRIFTLQMPSNMLRAGADGCVVVVGAPVMVVMVVVVALMTGDDGVMMAASFFKRILSASRS